MATVKFNFSDGVTLTGTSGDDLITVAGMEGGAGADESATIVGGAGSDTVVFDGVLTSAASGFTPKANGFEFIGADDDDVTATGVEFFQFENGTVTFGASVTPELLMVDALEQDSGATSAWDVTGLLEYDGSDVDASAASWSISTVDGSSISSGNTVTVLDGTTVLGTISFDGSDLSFTADTAFQSALSVGEEADVSFEVVLTNTAGGTFTETLTAVVAGVVSEGNDTLISAAGVEESFAPTENGALLGGDDYAVGNDGADSIFGGEGNDTIYAGATDDDADFFIGGDDDDVIAGGAGNDVLVGDEYIIDETTGPSTVAEYGATTDEGSNTLYGGAGGDAIAIGDINFSSATATADEFTVANVVAGTIDSGDVNSTTGGEAYGGAGDDAIIGTGGADVVGLGDGADYADVGAGNDTVYAGADDTGTDTVVATAGDNTIYTGAGIDSVIAGAGNDLIGAGDGNDVIGAGDGNNTVYGGAGNDSITAGDNNDALYGGAGNDTIISGNGTDIIYGGAGDDTMSGGTGVDTFVFEAGFGEDNITAFTSGTDFLDLTALGLDDLSDAVIATGAGSTTITFDEDTSITYAANYDADDILL